MALNKVALTTALTSLFSNPPDSIDGCAAAWADAMESYATSIVPASTTVPAAASDLEAALKTTFVNNGSTAMLTTLESDFLTFATTVGGGMTGYTSTPPPGLVGFSTIGNADTHATAAANFANKIDTWMKTGIATLIVSPYTVVNWS